MPQTSAPPALPIRSAFVSGKMLSLLGLCFVHTWLYLPLILGEAFGTAYHISNGCAFLAIALVLGRRSSARFPLGFSPRMLRAISWVASVFMCLSPLLLLASEEFLLAATVACAVIDGIALACIQSIWFVVYCRVRTRTAVNYVLVAIALSAAIRFVLVSVPFLSQVLLIVVFSIMPLFSQLFLVRAVGKPPQEGQVLQRTFDSASPPSENPRAFGSLGFFVELVILGLILGVLQNGIPGQTDTALPLFLGHALRFLLPMMLLAWINLSTRSERNEMWLRSVVVLFAVSLAVLVFFRGSISVVIPCFILVARSFVGILLYLMLFRIVRDYDVHPFTVSGIGRGIFNLALATGLAWSGLAHLPEALASVSDTTFYFSMTCVLLLLFNGYSRVSSRIIRVEPQHDQERVLRVASLEEQCGELIERFSLTEREAEVLKMTVEGRTKRYIAETLYLSEDTIRWHTKHLYRKLDVHNKQELLTLIGFK